jgi:hypothetical protein
LAYIRTALKITDSQEKQWNAYADFVRKRAQALEERIAKLRSERRERAQRPNGIERLERRQARYAQAAARLNELLAVQRPLYEALSPEQRRVADVVLVPGQREAGRHARRHGRWG